MPDTCLQGDEFPAHIIWDKLDKVEISIRYPETIEVKAIYNVPTDGIEISDERSIKITDFEVNGYLGILFCSRILVDFRKRERVQFEILDLRNSSIERFTREIDLFRPALKLESVPPRLNIKYDSSTRSYKIGDKIRIRNLGDGTALISVGVGEGDFQRHYPQGIDDFAKAFVCDLEIKLNVIRSEYPEHSSLIDKFLSLLKQPITLDGKTKAIIQSVFNGLARAFEESEGFYNNFVSAVAISYLKNIQLITELKTFMEYLNSIGEGRIILVNSVDVLKAKRTSGRMHLVIQITDLAYNDYPPIELPSIPVTCEGSDEVPIHMLFDWKAGPLRREEDG